MIEYLPDGRIRIGYPDSVGIALSLAEWLKILEQIKAEVMH